jgi:hypothetical protein
MVILNILKWSGSLLRGKPARSKEGLFQALFSSTLFAILGLLVSGSAQAEELGLPAATSPSSHSVVVSSPPAVPVYEYGGDRFRDPFVPLVGNENVGFDTPRPSSEPISPFNPVGAELKGVLKTTTGRWAVIRTSDGVTYLVQNGKVFDPKRKAVEGFQGIVKEKTVVILGPKNQEVEVRLKKDAEALKVP